MSPCGQRYRTRLPLLLFADFIVTSFVVRRGLFCRLLGPRNDQSPREHLPDCPVKGTVRHDDVVFVRQAYFLGANDPYRALKSTLKAEIDEDAWASLNSETSRPFVNPASGRIAVKVINHLGDEVMKVFAI
jgi:hypothetical protein